MTGSDVVSRWACLVLMCTTASSAYLLYTDALVYSAECLKYEQSGILNEII